MSYAVVADKDMAGDEKCIFCRNILPAPIISGTVYCCRNIRPYVPTRNMDDEMPCLLRNGISYKAEHRRLMLGEDIDEPERSEVHQSSGEGKFHHC